MTEKDQKALGKILWANLNISRYVSTAVADEEIDLLTVNGQLVKLEGDIKKAKDKHNEFLKELGLLVLP